MCKVKKLFLVFIVFAFQGCLEYNISTDVKSDKITRTIKIVSSSEKSITNPFKAVFDNSWRTEVKRTDDSTQKNIFIATKDFENIDDMNKNFNNDSATGLITIRSFLETKFYWFYTYYDYSEKYLVDSNIKFLPSANYFTKDDLDKIINYEPDEYEEKIPEYENKMNRWYAESTGELITNNLILAGERTKGFNVEKLKEKKKQISKIIANSEMYRTSSDAAFDSINQLPGIKDLHVVIPEFQKLHKKQTEKIALLYKLEGTFKPEIKMPGILLSTSSTSVIGNKSKWSLELPKLLLTEVQLKAESREVNMWAFVLSGILAIASIFVISFPIIKQNRMIKKIRI